jgi:type IV pilus assembly protein PilA
METTNTPRLVRALRNAYDQKKGRTELEGAEAGFTLIELMVVLLIMAILLAIAIPTFLGVKSGAYDRGAQSNLVNSLTSAKAGYANGGTYGTTPALEQAALGAAEPNITYTATGSVSQASGNSVSVNVSGDGNQVLLVSYSQSGMCWAAEDNEGAATALTNTPSSQGVQYAHWAPASSACVAVVPAAETWASHF